MYLGPGYLEERKYILSNSSTLAACKLGSLQLPRENLFAAVQLQYLIFVALAYMAGEGEESPLGMSCVPGAMGGHQSRALSL